MIVTTVVSDISKLEALAPRWRELLARAGASQPTMTPTWALAWWRRFGETDGRKLRAVAFEKSGALVGLALLSIRRVLHKRAIPLRRIELLMTGEPEEDEICSDYVGVVAAKGKEREVARGLAKALLDGALGGWDELLMPQMNGDDPMVDSLQRALVERGIDATVALSGECPYTPLPSTWEAYLKSLDGSRRYVVSRSLRELDKWAGKDGWTLVRAATPEQLREGRRILHDLHSERWSASGRSGVFASARFVGFHDEVMPRLLEGVDGGLDLYWLTIGHEPVAVVYNIVHDGKVYFYQSGRKLEVPKNAKPGIAIHALVMQRAIEAGIREYDFLAGVSQYKKQLALASRNLVTLRAVAPSIRARTLDGVRRLAEAGVRRLRQRRRGRAD